MTIRLTSESLAAGPSLDDALAANRAFYHAFSSRDLATMDTIWARGVTGPVHSSRLAAAYGARGGAVELA